MVSPGYWPWTRSGITVLVRNKSPINQCLPPNQTFTVCNIDWLAFNTHFLKNGPFPASFSLFLSFQYTVDSKQMFDINKFLPMTGFKPRTSGIGSNHSTNWATTTSLNTHFWWDTLKTVVWMGSFYPNCSLPNIGGAISYPREMSKFSVILTIKTKDQPPT